MWDAYHQPQKLSEALALLAEHGERARLIAGGTDLIIELERGLRSQRILIDVTRIAGLRRIELDDAAGEITLGPLVTHNDAIASPLLLAQAFPLVRACWEVGAPQIRSRGAIAGNLVTASPANDAITPLWALDGAVTLTSQQRGQRRLSFAEFFLGVRRTALQPDEMLTAIHLRALPATSRGTFIKLGLRRAQAISVVNVAIVLDLDGELVTGARITLGAVAPTILRVKEAEAALVGRSLSDMAIFEASELAAAAVNPIDDVRSSADYRRSMAGVLTERALRQLRAGQERNGWPANPVLLEGKTRGEEKLADAGANRQLQGEAVAFERGSTIELTLNGHPATLEGAAGKTLLRALRENAHLIGVKEGCAEGECGACTVWLDGVAIMSCLTPAEQAHGCRVVTIEGLARNGELHPVQAAFVSEGGVQCGYCTPGLIMSGAKLLEERPRPTVDDIQQALAGNLCRCTGYAKVIAAIQKAAGIEPE